jgi:hypothetical protein
MHVLQSERLLEHCTFRTLSDNRHHNVQTTTHTIHRPSLKHND